MKTAADFGVKACQCVVLILFENMWIEEVLTPTGARGFGFALEYGRRVSR